MKEKGERLTMWAICQHEFFRLFKSVKSLITIAFITGVSYWISDALRQAASMFSEAEFARGPALGVFGFLLLLGPLFVFSLSHDVVNRELAGRTIRFLVTRISRHQIVMGKFLGVALFWLVCLLLSFGVVLITAHSFDGKAFWQCLSFLLYFVALTLLLSILIPLPRYTMFLGVVLSLGMPFLGLWSVFSEHPTAKWLTYLLPYVFIEKGSAWTGILWLYAGLFLLASLFLFQRRDC
ncbi:ABC transporter permease [Brevibacillus ruminantium]|uniref:ABC transporter permease n=1 Tax=Brevibacillus ruminantium TaxID=2950604 RepID=A0ABY4W9S7_9BACL|nr:ABC transporter permease subunit [Brevibacillus ruminantium]USG63928.1 ABC transporter permease [Brevibacillus ruminantium]